MNWFPSTNLTGVFNHLSQNIAQFVLPWTLYRHILNNCIKAIVSLVLQKITFQTRIYHTSAMLYNKQPQNHFKFKESQSCFIFCKCYTDSCRLSKHWQTTMIRCRTHSRRGIWVYTVFQCSQSGVILFGTFTQNPVHKANSGGNPDQTRRSVASDHGLHVC